MADTTSQSAGTPQPAHKVSIFWFAATTLLGAFLVFQVQPVISKCVLPWFGGTPAVWTTCMLFFQILLFGGYLYAHVLRTYCRPALQAVIQLSLLSVAIMMLPIEPSEAWKPTGSESPTLYLLWLLMAHVGLPYFVLSSTGPLIQAWFSYHDQSDRVYRLYALSNAGSLVALLSYPFLVEPFLSVSTQSLTWSLMLCGFLVVQGMVAIKLFRVRPDSEQSTCNPQEASGETATTIPWRIRAVWLGLPAFASVMLLVITNHICQDVAVVPFLWVLPLSLYLLSFIICFDSPQWYHPKWVAVGTVLAIVGIEMKEYLPYQFQLLSVVASFMTLLLGVCLMCHGEVARLKPPARLLTQYYAMMSAGGAIGGIVVAILCPILFDSFIELPISMVLVQTLTFVIFISVQGWKTPSYDWDRVYRLRLFVAMVVFFPMISLIQISDEETIASERNFFGVLRVLQDDQGLHMVHGSTIHGMQRFGEFSTEPTKYYGRDSGVGRAIAQLQSERDSIEVGIVGLGCGVLTCYGRPSDEYDLIEINPAVVEIAQEHFTFMRDCPSVQRHHLGDGRLVLERLADTQYDLLVLDAFSSDAIPAHLMTVEAMQLFRSRLKPQGVMAIHVSNTHLDLAPLVHRLCQHVGLDSRQIKSQGDDARCTSTALWILVTESQNPIWKTDALAIALQATSQQLESAPLWTDQHHNLTSVLRIW